MPEARVTLTFVVNNSMIQDFIETMTDAAESFEDNRRCPSVDKIQDMRCELPRSHITNGGPSRHHHGRLSWSETTTVADSKVDHYGCPSPGPIGSCDKSPHHHWIDPDNKPWVIQGWRLNCERDHLAEWKAGTL